MAPFAGVTAVLMALAALAAPPAVASGSDTGSFLGAVNAARASAGRPAYSLQSDLSAVAYRWAQHMASTGQLAHNPNLSSQVSNWRWVGENVGYGPDWRSIEDAFMASPAHRSNILDHDFTQIGIGVVVHGSRMWVAQVFRQPMSTGSHGSSHSSSASSTSGAAGSAPAHQPSPRQLLSKRISVARAKARDAHRDVLQSALSFAAAMRTVGG